MNFFAKDVWKNDDNGGYKIDMMNTQYFENYRNGVVNLYLNLCRYSAIKYNENISLDSVKNVKRFK